MASRNVAMEDGLCRSGRMRRPSRSELIKAILLACAFLFWAANQLWPTLRQATLFNDVAIALFVFDVFLAMTSRPDPIS